MRRVVQARPPGLLLSQRKAPGMTHNLADLCMNPHVFHHVHVRDRIPEISVGRIALVDRSLAASGLNQWAYRHRRSRWMSRNHLPRRAGRSRR